MAPRNGDMVRLAPGRAEIIDEVPAGRLYVDGGVITAENGEALRERRHASHSGVLVVAIALDQRGRIASGPQVSAIGLPDDGNQSLGDALDDMADAVESTVKSLSAEERGDDDLVEQAVNRALKRASHRAWGRRPIVETTVLRV